MNAITLGWSIVLLALMRPMTAWSADPPDPYYPGPNSTNSRWMATIPGETITIDYFFDTSLRPDFGQNTAIRDEVMAAISDWNDALLFTGIPIELNFRNEIFLDAGGLCPLPGFRGIVFRYGTHNFGQRRCSGGVTNATQGPCGEARSAPDPPEILSPAATTYTYSDPACMGVNAPCEIDWAVVEINDNVDWNVLVGFGWNLRNAVAHEIGHVLGLSGIHDKADMSQYGIMAVGTCNDPDIPVDGRTISALGCIYGGTSCYDKCVLGYREIWGGGFAYPWYCQCGAHPHAKLQSGTRTYEVAIGTEGGVQVPVALLTEEERSQGYAHYASNNYHNAVMRLRVYEANQLVDEYWTYPSRDLQSSVTTLRPDSVINWQVEVGTGMPSCAQYSLFNGRSQPVTWWAQTSHPWVAIGGATSGTIPGGGTSVLQVCYSEVSGAPSPGDYIVAVRAWVVSGTDTIAIRRTLRVTVELCPAKPGALPHDMMFSVAVGGSSSSTVDVENGTGACQPMTFQASAAISAGPAQRVDVEGSTAAVSLFNGRYIGNVYQPSQSTSLLKIESHLNFTGSRELNYVVYEALAEGGPFSQIFSQTVQATGTGLAFYGTSPMSVGLQAGKFYIVGVGWTGGNVTYYWNTAAMPHAVSFGQKYYGFRTDGYPLSAQITSPTYFVANYYQRVTTQDMWLSVSPNRGTLVPGDRQILSVAVSSAGLAQGIYVGSVRVATNADGGTVDTVGVAMTVGAPANSAVCNLSSSSFSVALRPGQAQSRDLVVTNDGDPGSVLLFSGTIQRNATAVLTGDYLSIAGSTVNCAETSYSAGATATLHLSVRNNSADDEWLRDFSLDFPPGVVVTSASNFVGGTVGPMVWGGATGDGALVAWHGDTGAPDYYGVIRGGETANATINVSFSATLSGSLVIPFVLTGDQWGALPHTVTGSLSLQSAPASVTVTFPNGGERLAIGSTKDIKWASTGSLPSVRIDLSRDNGVGWQAVVGSTANNGAFSWTIAGPTSSNCLVRVSSPNLSVADQSNARFMIYEPVSWVQAVPATGIVNQGQSRTVQLRFDTNGLAEGSYNAVLMLDHNGNSSPASIPLSLFVHHSVNAQDNALPDGVWLAANYPNPFGRTTTIDFGLPTGRRVTLTVYDLQGRAVRTLAKSDFRPGQHRIVWDGRDERGVRVPSGTYFCSLKAGEEVRLRKMVVSH